MAAQRLRMLRYSHRRNTFSEAWSWSGIRDWCKQCDAGETGAGQDAH